MTRTFLVAIDLDPSADTVSFAEQLQEDLQQDGYDVTSVHPWAAPSEHLSDPMVGQVGLPTELHPTQALF